MALPTITIDDFVGGIEIIKGTFDDRLDTFINDYYPQLVREIIGVDAYEEILAETPLTKQKWLDLFNGANYYSECTGRNEHQVGLKKVVLQFIYFEYGRLQQIRNTGTGKQRNEPENSLVFDTSKLYSRELNIGIGWYNDQFTPFVNTFETLLMVALSSIEVAGVYTVTVANTKYLYDGDLVDFAGDSYAVSNVTDTTFDFVLGTSGNSLIGLTFYYEPYKDFPLPSKRVNPFSI
jgi:hypothetical protein